MKNQIIVLLIFAAILFFGGYMGYQKAQSLPSLVMGTVFAVVMIACAWGLSSNMRYSYLIAEISTAILVAFFFYRFTLSLKLFPSAFMSIVSLAVLLYLVLAKRKASQEL